MKVVDAFGHSYEMENVHAGEPDESKQELPSCLPTMAPYVAEMSCGIAGSMESSPVPPGRMSRKRKRRTRYLSGMDEENGKPVVDIAELMEKDADLWYKKEMLEKMRWIVEELLDRKYGNIDGWLNLE